MKPKLHTSNEVYDAIVELAKTNDMPPTIEELRVFLKVGSSRTVLRYLRQMEDEGWIQRWPGARGIRLLPRPKMHSWIRDGDGGSWRRDFEREAAWRDLINRKEGER